MNFNIFPRKMEVKELRSQVKDLQHSVDILLGEVETRKSYVGNAYQDYRTAINELCKKYEGTADWGVLQVGNIVDIRSAFIIGQGMKPISEKKDSREFEFIQEFIRYNDLDEELPQELAKEAELEGRVLVRLIPNKEKKQIDVRFVSYNTTGYKVICAEGDYKKYEKVKYRDSSSSDDSGYSGENVTMGDKDVVLDASEFVYKKFSGRITKVNDVMPKVAKVLTQCENLDKAMYDWRRINGLFASPTPVIKCEDVASAQAISDKIKTINWKIGKLLILAKAEYTLVGADVAGATALEKEIIANAKIISGATGVPVHFLGYPELMSNRAVSCYDEETETLTENGWKKYYEIGNDEKIACFDPSNNSMVFEKPKLLYVHRYEGEMIHFKNKSNDIMVTPDHKMWTFAKQGKFFGKGGGKEMIWQKIQAKDLVNRFRIQFRDNCNNWNGEEIKEIIVKEHDSFYKNRDSQPVKFKVNDFVEFLGYYLSEGGCGLYKTTGKRKKQYHSIIHIAQNEGEKADRINDCLLRLGLRFNRAVNKGCVRWHIHHSGLAEYLKSNFGEGNKTKKIPAIFKNLPIHQLNILFDSLMLGDGHLAQKSKKGKRGYYCSNSKRLIDDVQEIMLKLGYSTGNVRSNKKISSINKILCENWRVEFFRKKNRHIFKSDIQKVNYSGIVYCFNTRTGVYFTRRNGRVAIQGNTDLFEFINASCNKERNVWTGFYEELFYKALVMAQKFQTGYNPDKNPVKAKIVEVTEAKMQELVNVWLPLYTANVVDLDYMLGKIPDIDPDRVKRSQEE
ncbi:MAG: LAGLIDADG family homing endonuclease, partial [Candidatus Omnitrophota bacterium]